MKNNNLKYNLYDDVKDVIKSCVVSIIPTRLIKEILRSRRCRVSHTSNFPRQLIQNP